MGIIRVSRRAGREGESFISPTDQRKRIEEACRRDSLELVSVAEEIDVSGGTALDRRDGLREAIEAVEDGAAQVVVVGYFDRLFRSVVVQAEVVSRIEAAGGEVLALDFGKVSEASAAQWLSGTMMGAFAEYYRRSAGERSRSAQIAAVERGVPPFPSIPLGYERADNGKLVPTAQRDLVVAAFRMREGEASIREVRGFLRGRGADLTFRQVQGLLSNRLLVGEIHFGDLVNREAHEPIVDRDLFDRVQSLKIARGPKPASTRLLARLGVLRCGTCGARLVTGFQTQGGRRYDFYRCNPMSDCPRRVTIGADIAEKVVVDATKKALADIEGRASAESEALEAAEQAERDQAALDSTIRAFAQLTDEPVAIEKLAALRDARDASRERAEHLGHLRASRILSIDEWDQMSLEARRGLIRGTVESATVRPGRSSDRIALKLFGQ